MANTITRTSGGGLAAIDMHFEGDQSKVDATITAAGRWIYDVKGKFNIDDGGDPPVRIPYDDLTVQQKLYVILYAVKDRILFWADSQYRNEALPIAEQEIETEADNLHSMGA